MLKTPFRRYYILEFQNIV